MSNELIIATLKEAPAKFDETIRLIEKVFSYTKENSFIVDFAPVANKNNFDNSLIATFEGKVIAHVSLIRRNLRVGKIDIPVALIGGVAVEQDFQNKGIAKQLINRLISENTTHVSLFFLWSNLIEFYLKFKFYPCIGMAESIASPENLNEILADEKFDQTLYKDLNAQDKEKIKTLYNDTLLRKYSSLSRSNDDWKTIEKITSANLFIYRNKKDIEAYFFINKGQDLTNIIHEFGYQSNTKNKMQKLFNNSTVWVPEHEKELLNERQVKYLGLARIGNTKLFQKHIEAVSKNTINCEEIDHDAVDFNFANKSYMVTTAEFLTYVFGPSPLLEFQDFEHPIYISGLDSI